MDIDEAGRHEAALGVDGAGRRLAAQVADGGDAIAVDRHVGSVARRCVPVDDGAASDHQIVCHGGLPCGRVGRRSWRADAATVARMAAVRLPIAEVAGRLVSPRLNCGGVPFVVVTGRRTTADEPVGDLVG